MSEIGKYPIIDLHTCIQGEGKYAGIPHVLIRLSGCNLKCQFKENICDTPYSSWFPEHGNFSVRDVEDLFRKHNQIKHTFITGGEPFLFPGITEELIQISKKYNHFVAAETNGTLYETLSFDFVTISPKLNNSIPIEGSKTTDPNGNLYSVSKNDTVKHSKNRLKLPVLKLLIQTYSYQLKFVIQDESDIEEALSLSDQLEVPRDKIYLMPEGITNLQIQERRKWLIEKCISYGVNYSDRLHILAYGDKREA